MTVAFILSLGFENLILSLGILLVNNEEKIWLFLNKFYKYEFEEFFIVLRVVIRWIGFFIILIVLK